METFEQCQICYSQDKLATILKPCQHKMCYECVTLTLPSKGLCPFCKQDVCQVIGQDHLELSLSELRAMYPNENIKSFQEEAQMNYLNHDFFEEDINILTFNLRDCYQRLRKTISQKDLEFDKKWSIFDKVEVEVGKITKLIREKCEMEPVDIFNKIHELILSIEEMKQNRWGSAKLDVYKEKINVSQDEDFIDKNFFIKSKNKKKKLKK